MTSIQDQIFTASNGLRVHTPNPGWLEVPDPRVGGKNLLSPSQVDALREYFTAERDKELGRWWSPEYPDLVCYPREEDLVIVLNECTGETESWTRGQAEQGWNEKVFGFYTARRYFEAHPKPEPRPWETAENRSIWVLTIDGRDPEPYMWSDRTQQFTHAIGGFPLYRPERVTAGHQIWPVVSEEGDDK